MPKIVNHELRKVQIAEATWKVIVKEGLENATVRNIARESGLSVGSLRHYFPSQSDLLLFSMELVSERVLSRINQRHQQSAPQQQPPSGPKSSEQLAASDAQQMTDQHGSRMDQGADPLEALVHLIGEMLPLDEDRRVETEVWYVFTAKALVDERLKQLSEKVYEDMSRGFEMLVRKMQSFGLLRDDLQIEFEAKRLHAIVDGMAVHHLLYPRKLSYEDVVGTLYYHLRSMCGS